MDFEAEAKALLNTLIAKCVHPFVWRGHLADALRRAYEAGVAAGKDSCAWMEPLVYRGDA